MTTATTRLEDPVGPQEIAERLNVSTATVHSWRSRAKTAIERKPLPEPALIISNTPIWEWEAISAWAEATGRLDPGVAAAYEEA